MCGELKHAWQLCLHNYKRRVYLPIVIVTKLQLFNKIPNWVGLGRRFECYLLCNVATRIRLVENNMIYLYSSIWIGH